MIAQLTPKKIKMIKNAMSPLKNLLPREMSNVTQLMSSGAGTFSLFVSNLAPL